MDKGDTVNLSSLTLSPHGATHMDAPLHFTPDGAGMDEIPLRRFIGPCLVLDIFETCTEGCGSVPLKRELMEQTLATCAGKDDILPRILFKTGYTPGRTFNPLFSPFTGGAIRALAERGVKLIGTDAPSIDAYSSTDLPAHRACADAGICILEHLELSGVTPGPYRLHAAPLKIDGAEGAPVRAVLLPVEG